jgi:membrane associated rhomboid family serine protease
MISTADQPPHPLVGASGAIMGLAGMYLVLMPMHKVHMAFWYRLGLLFRFELKMKLFAIRGLWVVLFYIAFDVIYTIFGIEDNVAHWAHLGGFILGVVIGLLLLITRLVNCRSGDILSGIFGRYAWPLVGRPDSSRKSIIASWF